MRQAAGFAAQPSPAAVSLMACGVGPGLIVTSSASIADMEVTRLGRPVDGGQQRHGGIDRAPPVDPHPVARPTA
jgi:hypothetical protein